MIIWNYKSTTDESAISKKKLTNLITTRITRGKWQI